MTDPRRALPSVNALLSSDAVRALLHHASRPLVTQAVRDAVDRARNDPRAAPRDEREWALAIRTALAAREQRSLRPVLNATGVVLHTNLGRAPLPRVAIDAMCAIAQGYSNLEYDLEHGQRGSRYTHCVTLLRELSGAEDALVVDNGAAALVLALNTFAEGRAAIVSRGELVEIGGSFRVPDIMAKSGARLVEVGATNRTHLEDYRRAVSRDTGAIVKVHRSNFAMEGFVSEVAVPDLAALGAEHDVPVLHDLGSGLLISLDAFGLRGEPTAGDALRAGASLVTMSGDKLLGGPQAGLVLGRADLVARLRANPLTRAFRVDKLTLAALEATLALYRDPETAMREIPTLAMLAAPVDSLRTRATALCGRLAGARVASRVVPSEASVGGGAFPTARLASVAVALAGDAPAHDARLRAAPLPVVGRIADDEMLLDLRSVPPEADDDLASAVIAALRDETHATMNAPDAE
ncbi:MAG TPA: L-seryl-tRNA(Sec) selenium transferase [Gemmatimonadaceae bacterium]|nr:L-seryl-tRNA(Sec) selenium transferase [Gemmatimonadaceae bacterium]